jgi:two-component system nitrogen regulation response regulator GlnG
VSEDRVDVAMLYDAARGFLAARDPDSLVRHALLSALGSAGARFAVWLAPDARGTWVVRGARGIDAATKPFTPSAEERARLAAGAPLTIDALPAGAALAARAAAFGAVVCAPLVHDDGLAGALLLGAKLAGGDYSERDLALVGEVARLVAAGTASLAATPAAAATPRGARGTAALRARHPELRALHGDGAATAALFGEILAIAPHEFPVLVIGETGTGKELVARALHDLGPRAAKPFEAQNCAAIPRELVASALFGHERGAFTGAVGTAVGAFERAGDGTLFLDEIGDMPLETQAMLLRVLQEQRFRRVGGDKMLPARARIVSATNLDLQQAVEAGRFRADLFYRLQMYVVRLAPLRERPEDVPALVEHLLGRHRAGSAPRASEAFVAALAARELRGNVRELEALLVGALVRASGAPVLLPDHLPAVGTTLAPIGSPARARSTSGVMHAGGSTGDGITAPSGGAPALASSPALAADAHSASPRTYDDMERAYIRSILHLTAGNKKRAAEIMAIPRTTLAARMRKLGLDPGASR